MTVESPFPKIPSHCHETISCMLWKIWSNVTKMQHECPVKLRGETWFHLLTLNLINMSSSRRRRLKEELPSFRLLYCVLVVTVTVFCFHLAWVVTNCAAFIWLSDDLKRNDSKASCIEWMVWGLFGSGSVWIKMVLLLHQLKVRTKRTDRWGWGGLRLKRGGKEVFIGNQKLIMTHHIIVFSYLGCARYKLSNWKGVQRKGFHKWIIFWESCHYWQQANRLRPTNWFFGAKLSLCYFCSSLSCEA